MSRSSIRRLVGLATIAVVAPLTAAAVAAVGTGSLGPVGAMAAPARTMAVRPLVIRISAPGFGHVLATRGRLPLYTFGPERKDHRIHCVGSCATAWPPVIVPAGTRVPVHMTGLAGTFGTIARTKHARQLTHNRLPLYTFAFDSPGRVTGNGTGGFSVVRG